jgi:hypothetical protein
VLVALVRRERCRQHDARVVDQDVSAVELLLHAFGCRDDRVAVGAVGLDRDGAVAELVGERLDALDAACEQRDAVTVRG